MIQLTHEQQERTERLVDQLSRPNVVCVCKERFCIHWQVYAVKVLSPLLDSDSQAARQPVGWISCGLRHGHDRIVDIVFENAGCAKAFIDGVEPVAGPIVAATRMRDKCVEKVNEIAEEYRSLEHEVSARALDDAALQLQSLTLDREKQQ